MPAEEIVSFLILINRKWLKLIYLFIITNVAVKIIQNSSDEYKRISTMETKQLGGSK